MSSQHRPPVVHSVVKPTVGQSIKEGFGLGIGSAVGQRLVSAVFGPPTIKTVAAPAPSQTDLWVRCLEQTQGDVEKCAPFKPLSK
jgi:hypothetical protein